MGNGSPPRPRHQRTPSVSSAAGYGRMRIAGSPVEHVSSDATLDSRSRRLRHVATAAAETVGPLLKLWQFDPLNPD